MARILFGANPASGHVRPGLPVARELVARGHEVVWYASPRFRSSVERTGARLAPFRRGLDFDEADLDTSFPGRVGRSTIRQLQYDIRAMFIDTIPAHLEDLRALADESPMNLVVMESSFLAGAFLAEERRLPWAVYGITPLTMRSVDCAPMGFGLLPRDDLLGRLRHRALNWLVERVVFAAAQRRFQQVRAQVGLPRSEPFFLDHTSALAPVYLQGTIPEFEYPRRDLPANVHFVGALLPEAPGGSPLPPWWDELRASRPVVLVTQGTVQIDPALLLEPSIDAMADDDILLIGTTGGAAPEQILQRRTARNVRLETFIPFADLLPHVDVVVTNGGYGGTQQALAHGIPVVAAGVTEGKNEVAARLEWSGAGINLRTEKPAPAQIRTAVHTLLNDPSYRLRARELQKSYATRDAAASAADLIEGLLSSTSPSTPRQRAPRSTSKGNQSRSAPGADADADAAP